MSWGQNGTEPKVVVPVRRVVVAVRRPAVDRVVVPTAAPIHTVRALWLPPQMPSAPPAPALNASMRSASTAAADAFCNCNINSFCSISHSRPLIGAPTFWSACSRVAPVRPLPQADKNVGAPQKIATAARALLLPLSYSCPFRAPLRSQSSLVPRSPRLLRSALRLNSLTWGQNGTEPEVAVVPVRRAAVAAVRRPAVERVGVPTAAPIHTARAR